MKNEELPKEENLNVASEEKIAPIKESKPKELESGISEEEYQRRQAQLRGLLDNAYSSTSEKKFDEKEALRVIEKASEIVNDIDALPLGSDRVYQEASILAGKNLDLWGRGLFELARTTKGELRCRYAQALDHLRYLVKGSSYDDLLKGLMTNREAITELYKQGLREMGFKDPDKEISRREKEEVWKDMKKALGPAAVPMLIFGRIVGGVERMIGFFKKK